ncbi:MAG: hypothetical protein NXY57DRAFT_904142 [Lentinula lateritia]|uniref:Molybdopterin synthase sulfur carrier subunit n=1 Tax=Lentinula lateritia TaxID=40482 RepID=A0ABQ8VWL1_9AGAR|nr:MAG: hypothetical protein NXY57DRAFT_904142 [Lentinula lateritia]KAJ4500705.1 hypothetical protein C8R41DRAFT_750885 [Lentinula lateritia]
MSSTSTSTAHITVLYFAAASTTLGITEEKIPIPEKGFDLSQLKDLLVERHSRDNPTLRKILDSSQWSVDAEMVGDDEDLTKVELGDGVEVAVICPVSGG